MSYGFSFNRRHCSEFGIVMQSVDRTVLPAKRRNKYEIPGRDGSFYAESSNYIEREIRVRILFEGSTFTLEALRLRIREIAKWLSAESVPLVFDDEPGKAYTASIYTGISLEQLRVFGECELTFLCQPFAESAQYITETKDVLESNDAMTVKVSGTQDTPCIITIKNIGTKDVRGITIQRKAEKL